MQREALRRRRRKTEQESFIAYLKRIWPWFIIEEVHLLIGGYLEALWRQDIDRLMQFLSPRAGKSMMSSVAGPSYYLGRYARREVMQAGHESELSIGFGRQAKNIILTPEYRAVFPGLQLSDDSKAAGRWHTNQGGGYFATGVNGGIAGKGYHWGSGDDLLNEQTAKSDTSNKRVIEWWGPGFYTRRAPNDSVISLTMTRWRKDDIAGHLLEKGKNEKGADQWTVLKIPALLDEVTAEMLNEFTGDRLLSPSPKGGRIKYKPGDSFAPRRWPLKEVLRQKANMDNPRDWDALYMQEPTQAEGAILKRSWWRAWTEKNPPRCAMVIQVYDTAFEEGEENDYTARTTWGVFDFTDRTGMVRPCVILLERLKRRIEFPELRHEAYASFKRYKPDKVLIEKKASGHSLIQELRRKGVPVHPIKVDKGNSKRTRANAAAVVLEQGCVFYMKGRDWAKEVIDDCAEFPFGDHDDIPDTVVYALLYLRRTFHVRLGDEPAEEDEGRYKDPTDHMTMA